MRNSRTGWMKLLRVMVWIVFAIIILAGVVLGGVTGPRILLIAPLWVLFAFCVVAGAFLKLDLLEDYHSMRLSLESIERSLRSGKETPTTPQPTLEEELYGLEAGTVETRNS